MPGGYTHFAVVRQLGTHRTLMSIQGMTEDIALGLLDAANYVELGAVSPDLPYLSSFSGTTPNWGYILHHERTVETVRAGVRLLPTLDPTGRERKRAMAWLFGYAAHVVADMIAHPVIALKVGPYETHKAQHRVCEMNQDVYVFPFYFQDTVTTSEYLKHGVMTCTADGHPGHVLAPFLNDFWRAALREVYPGKKTPAPRQWFRRFVTLIDTFAEEGCHFVSIMRGYLESKGYVYPETPDMTYVTDLMSPYGRRIVLHDLFARFEEETKTAWGQLAQAITQNNAQVFALPNGDLDTGIDLADHKTSVFWGPERGRA